ncbi:asparagine synthase (glutamine-hydrolyzing) [Burkholderia pseudomallei]|uniref:asparagine synthase (glutamine-hydrolyzing) n=2 Tax=Burkholderia pseudomallei TaxID=28450 RepID=UPI000CDDB705|nr:asparagine synthase (glutamine-hydrolyzing) [Burkholderia pseudomallei]
MCRIYGSYGIRTSEEGLKKVSDIQRSGGPDGCYFRSSGSWSIGANRLAIVGLQDGMQPFSVGDVHVVFNGEIYNHHLLRRIVRKHGYVVENACDGAILPALYLIYGREFVRHLDGMFALAVVDDRDEKKLLLANDSMGVKSLYYFHDQGSDALYFASELNGLFAFDAVPRRFDAVRIDEVFALRAVWGPNTSFLDVCDLLPGSILEMDLCGKLALHSYKPELPEGDGGTGGARCSDGAAGFGELFETEVTLLLACDVAPCVVTSGGLDSSLVTAMAASQRDGLDAFHVCYEGDWRDDERNYAREVATRCGVRYNEIELSPRRFPDLIESMSRSIGQPNSAPHALSTYALFEAIHAHGFKVALTGEGADEYFAGYQRFSDAAFDTRADWLDHYMDKLGPFPAEVRRSIYAPSFRDYLARRPSVVEPVRDRLLDLPVGGQRFGALLRMDQVDRMPFYIHRRVDHLSMAHSVEVRVPFCQPKVVAYANSLTPAALVDDKRSKLPVYEAAQGWLPDSIRYRKKQPFTFPVHLYFRPGNALWTYANDIFASRSFGEREIFDTRHLKNVLNRDEPVSTDDAIAVWCALTLESWLRWQEANGMRFAYRN